MRGGEWFVGSDEVVLTASAIVRCRGSGIKRQAVVEDPVAGSYARLSI